MTTGKLCLAALLGAMPALAIAPPAASADIGVTVNLGVDSYDTVAPGDPVESVDVFYDQLSPYGVWVDEPDVGRVFVPDTAGYVPYTNGHWQYTSLGFVWVSNEQHAWATSHYGRWGFSRNYGRWYWLPDTAWGPAWVEWRLTGNDFGWAPLAPEIVVRGGWQPPVEAWHYCSAEHVLDANVVRYYEPRERVVEIHRSARPLEHYSTISNVRVVVGPPAAVLHEHRIVVHPVRVEPRIVGRWSPAEAHEQVAHARDHRAVFETQNQRRIESNAGIRTAQTRVIEAHPQIRAQITARVQTGGARPSEPNHAPPAAAPAPQHAAPARVEPNRREPEHAAPAPQAAAPAPRAPEHGREPNPRERIAPPASQASAPRQPPAPAAKAVEPEHRAPEPKPAEHAQPPQRNEPPHATDHREPDRKEPDRKDHDKQ